MSQKLKRVNWPIPKAGMNTVVDPQHLGPGEAELIENFYFRSSGELYQRGGITKVASCPLGTTATVKNLHYWSDQDRLIANFEGNVYEYDIGGSTWTQVNDYSASTSHVGIEDFGVEGSNEIYLAPNDTIGNWDGTTHSAVSGTCIPKAYWLMSRLRQLYAIGDPDNPYTLDISDDLDATDWGGGNAFYTQIGAGEGVALVDWARVKGVLYLFSSGTYPTIWRWDGYLENNYRLSQIYWGLRCLPGTASASIDNVAFVTPHGVFDVGTVAQTGAQFERSLSSTINDKIQALSGPRAIYSPQLGCYLVCDEDTTVWVSNVSHEPSVWTKFTFPVEISVFASGGDTLYLGTTGDGSTGGDIYKYDPTAHQDNTGSSVAIEPVLTTMDNDFEDESYRKQIGGLFGDFGGCGADVVEVTVYTDHKDTAERTYVMDGNHKAASHDCRSMQLKMTFKRPSSRVIFRNFGTYMENKKRGLKQ